MRLRFLLPKQCRPSRSFPYSVPESPEESPPAPIPSPSAEMAPANAARDNVPDSDIEAPAVPKSRLLRLGVSQIPPAALESPTASPLAALHPEATAPRLADRR